MSANLQTKLNQLFDLASQEIQGVSDLHSLEEWKSRYLGKKSQFSEVLSALKNLEPEERKQVGATANELKNKLEDIFKTRSQQIEDKLLADKLANDSLDPTLPGTYFPQGKMHPIRLMMKEVNEVLELAGLSKVYGPEIELEEFCFDRLNFKKNHPARDMQATFFVKAKESEPRLVLRTHTSPVQVRVLMDAAKKSFPLPIRIQVPGRVYRVDDDATHSPMFHQVEGLVVDKRSGMGDLRAVLDFFFRKIFGSDTKVRFRPSFFPFTEPSAEVDVTCVFCSGKGCRTCKTSGWLEVAGAGLVHPEVFRLCGWNPDEVQGWAFGLGIDRLAMLKYGVSDLRLLFDNRLSFLRGKA